MKPHLRARNNDDQLETVYFEEDHGDGVGTIIVADERNQVHRLAIDMADLVDTYPLVVADGPDQLDADITHLVNMIGVLTSKPMMLDEDDQEVLGRVLDRLQKLREPV